MPQPPSPLHFVDDYLAALLAQASHLISEEFHAVVQAQGFSVTEWRVLATLSGSAGMSVGAIAQVALTKQPTVTRLLDRMAARGLVERTASEDDRRVTLVRMTAEGEATVSGLIGLARQHEANVLAPFGLRRAEQLKSMLKRMIELHRPAMDP